MEFGCKNNYEPNLKDQIKQIFLQISSAYAHSDDPCRKPMRQSKMFEDVYGLVKITAAPHYCMTLVVGTSDEPFVLPLTLIDSACHIYEWVSINKKKVSLNQLLVVCEIFQETDAEVESQCVTGFVKWENIKILECTDNHLTVPLAPKDNITTEAETEKVISTPNTMRIVVHHASMPFYNKVPPAFCLVLISYINSRKIVAKLWLVLKSEQVALREFLIPNREYIINFPPQTEKHYLDKSRKPLDKIFGCLNRELRVIFHHKNKFSTLDGSELPDGSKIFLTCNTEFSHFVYHFTKDLLCSWYSVDEAEYANENLVSFYGQVDSFFYLKETVYKSCYLCNQGKPKNPVLKESQSFVDQPWSNPWKSKLIIGKNEMLELPSTMEGNTAMKTGVPGKFCQTIKLMDLTTGRTKSIYINHSYVPNVQQMFRLAPGMTVYITHLIQRYSNAGNYYYIATIFSTIKILSYQDKEAPCENWGSYGLQHLTAHSKDRMWGVLESFTVTKVAITAKCSNCQANYFSETCSGNCSAPTSHSVSSYAIGWLHIIYDKHNSLQKKVLINNDSFIQKLFCIPDEVWQMLQDAAPEEEIVCFLDEQNPNQASDNTSPLSQLLTIYCNIPKRSGKFYICVRKMQSDESLYYCVGLEPIEKPRTDIVATLASLFSTD